MTTTLDLDAQPYGVRLKVLRLVAGLRQEDVSRLSGVSQVVVSNLERAYAPPARGYALEAARKVERVLTGAGSGAT